jgi:hypothetical protein
MHIKLMAVSHFEDSLNMLLIASTWHCSQSDTPFSLNKQPNMMACGGE